MSSLQLVVCDLAVAASGFRKRLQQTADAASEQFGMRVVSVTY